MVLLPSYAAATAPRLKSGYTLTENLLGSGTFSDVYEVTKNDSPVRFAVKLIKKKVIKDEKEVQEYPEEKIKMELKVLGLVHENILNLLEYHQDPYHHQIYTYLYETDLYGTVRKLWKDNQRNEDQKIK